MPTPPKTGPAADPAFPWPAPAKLNLLLRVVGRRTDGYHRLQTVFQFLDRCDQLRFTPRPDAAVRRNGGPAGVPEDQDLTVRAARRLQEATGCRRGVEIHLDKRLPLGGGLGGGSSDAATTLVALNRIWGLGLGVEHLAELGLGLGADVPVFVRGHAAWGEGVGEQLTPLELETPWYLVLVPAVLVSTREVFQAPELTRNSVPITITDFLAGTTTNDCEPVVRARYPEVDQALAWLSRHGAARLTGTGACVFAGYPVRSHAEAVMAALPAGWNGFVARGLNRSPLLDAMDAK
ncbi:MAG: 4-(cytidine 5'-diphospho)-2-C-methyl-D-erythritol kinase [Chromatiales bacterium 21-64-14]|nr:MAG: 4-(cytidine 5'-diphospho)-2-C-methyl-D-erythritol kinase [Chromatiales bacterium 21-64-14]